MTLKMSKDENIEGIPNGIKKRVDPHELLESLSDLLGPEGQIKSMEEVQDIASKMQDAPKMVSRCTYMNILKATKDQAVLEKFMDTGGWDVLNKWLMEGKESDNVEFLKDLLQVYQQLPVTVAILKQNSCAKTIKQLIKTSEDADVKQLATTLVDKWMKIIKGGQSTSSSSSSTSSSDKEKDRKKKHKEGEHSRDHKSRHRHQHHRDSEKGQQSPDHKGSPDHKAEQMDTEDSKNKDSKVSERDSYSKSESTKSRPVGVKIRPTKFRPTGLEQERKLPMVKKKPAEDTKPPVKRASDLTSKPKPPPEKKARTSPPTSPGSVMTSIMNSMNTTTTMEKQGGVKLIAPLKRPDIYESSGFMDAMMQTPSSTIVRKRRRLSSNNNNKPTSPTSPPAKQPAVPSFYKDTMETGDDSPVKSENAENEVDSEKARSVSPTENGNGDSEKVEEEGKTRSPTPIDGGDSNSSTVDSENSGEPKKKKSKKSVKWAPDANLREFFYFELDETERVNVNKKTFADIKKEEMARERQAMASARGFHNMEESGSMPWRRPPMIADLTIMVESGCNSRERDVQAKRELGVLQALFFSKEMIPDSAKEPDPESPTEPTDVKIIPLEDESGAGGEIVHQTFPDPVDPSTINIRKPQPKDQPPPLLQTPPMQGQPPQPQFALPPDVAKLLANMAQQNNPEPATSPSQESRPPQLNEAQLQQLFNSIMSQNPSQDDPMTAQLRQALEPFREQFMMQQQQQKQQQQQQMMVPQQQQPPKFMGNALLPNPGQGGPMGGPPMGLLGVRPGLMPNPLMGGMGGPGGFPMGMQNGPQGGFMPGGPGGQGGPRGGGPMMHGGMRGMGPNNMRGGGGPQRGRGAAVKPVKSDRTLGRSLWTGGRCSQVK